MTIGKKLTICFAALAALLLVWSITSLNSIGNLKQAFDKTADQTTKKIILADTISNAQTAMLAWQRATVMYTYGKEPAKVEVARQRFRDSAASLQRAMDEIRPLISTDEGRQLIEDIRRGHQDWVSGVAEVEQLCAAGNPDAAVKLAAEKILPISENLARQALRLADAEKQILTADRKAAESESSTARWLAFTLLTLSFGIGAATLFVIRQATTSLQRTAAEMGQGAEQVAGAAAQISTSSQALAQGASEQAASLEETSSSSEEINSMTSKNAQNSQAAAGLMTEAAQRVNEANRRLDQMVTSMKEINASSDKISKIIRVIDEIAFQTNILALNAAVEAARAGDAGMGFAVVADEVRNLAQRCAQAAKDTAGLIEESIAKSTEGSTRLDEVAAAIRSITESTTGVKTLVDEINLGSQEQARGIEQIAKAIAQMEQVTQRAAANAEENASAGEELSAQSGTLRHVVERLTALVGSANSSDAEKRRGARARRLHVPRIPGKAAASAGLAALGKAVGAVRAPAREKLDRDSIPLEDHSNAF